MIPDQRDEKMTEFVHPLEGSSGKTRTRPKAIGLASIKTSVAGFASPVRTTRSMTSRGDEVLHAPIISLCS